MAFWLKRWGTSEDGYRDGMLKKELSFGDRAMPRGVPRVQKTDRVIVTGTKTRGALVAAATTAETAKRTAPDSRWPWRCKAKFHLLCLVADAPRLDVIRDPTGKLRRWHRSRSGLFELTAQQFRDAEAAIRRAVKRGR